MEKIAIKFLIEIQVEEAIEVTPQELRELNSMDNEAKKEFFWNKAIFYDYKTKSVNYEKIQKERDTNMMSNSQHDTYRLRKMTKKDNK